jgi:hypothetical protein
VKPRDKARAWPKYGLEPGDTDHYRLMREFWADPKTFVATMLEE